MDYVGVKTTIYELGPILPGEVIGKKINIKNNLKESQDYEVHRDAGANFVCTVFYIDVERFTVAPGHSAILTVRYAPKIPFSADFEMFAVLTHHSVCKEFGILGRSIGPEVQLLGSHSIMLISQEKQKVTCKLALKNASAVVACYQFDVDGGQSVFAVDEPAGEMQPLQEAHVKVEFAPPREGLFTKQLTCLLLHQCPIIINVVGVCVLSKRASVKNVNYEWYVEPVTDEDGCSQFVGRPCFVSRHLPPLRLSQDCLDFGWGCGSNDSRHTFTVTNIMQEEISLEWNPDAAGVFSIEPERASIKSQHSAKFEACFKPLTPCILYGAQLDGLAHWGGTRHSFQRALANKHLHVPVCVTISLIGHSFPTAANPWVPQFKVSPTTVLMPPCHPPIPVHGSLLISREGHLPLTFRFIPPANSFFTVKPLQGLVRGRFQIVVVRMCPELHGEAAYSEDWCLQFNGSEQHQVTIHMRGFSEYPKVVVGNGNTVSLPVTYPDCEKAFCVPVKNISKHSVSYKYMLLSEHDSLGFDCLEGMLATNQTRWHTWTFSPRRPGSFSYQVRFKVHALRSAGTPTSITVSCHGESHVSELTAIPDTLSFGEVLWGMSTNQTFCLSNPGSSPVCYQLSCLPSTLLSTPDEDAELQPQRGMVFPGETRSVTVMLKPTNEGLHGFTIIYNVCTNLDSNKTVPGSKRRLVDVQYECIVPKLSISDLNVSGQGPLLGRISFWRTMEINKWNAALERVRPGQKETVVFGLPQFPVGHHAVEVYLLLAARCHFPVQWSVHRHQQCDCQPEQRTQGLSRRVTKSICPHKQLLTFTPVAGTLQGRGKQVLRMLVSYDMEGRFSLSHSLLLSCGREVQLDTDLVAHGPRQLSLAPENLHLRVFIADPDPAAQCVWAYNHTRHSLDYEVDVSQLEELNQQHFGCEVATCLNPRGTVQPGAALLLLFKVKPMRLQSLQMSAVLKVGAEQSELKLSSEGTVAFSHQLAYMRSQMPQVCRVPLEGMLVETSLHHAVLGPITTHTSVQHTFFLSSEATDTAFGYNWRSVSIPGVLEGTVVPGKGVLQAGCKQVCQLTVTSLGTPALLTFSLACELTHLTQRRQHDRSVRRLQALAAERKGEFTITKDGISYPEQQVNIHSKSPPVIHKVVSVTVHICSQRGIDAKIPALHQLRLAPSPSAAVVGITQPPLLSPDEAWVITSSLDTVIWEVLHCARLQGQLQQLAEDNAHITYGSFVMDEEQECRLLADSLTSPSPWLLTRTLADILYHLLLHLSGHNFPDTSLAQLRRMSTLLEKTCTNLQESHCSCNRYR